MKWELFLNYGKSFIEILLLWIVIYNLYKTMRYSRAAQIFIGLTGSMLLLLLISHVLKLEVIKFLLHNSFIFLCFTIIVIFQQDIRNLLAKLGNNKWIFAGAFVRTSFIDEFIEAARELSNKKHGALFAIERNNSLDAEKSTGVLIDSIFTKELIGSIFHPNTILHDGGMIITQGRVAAAGCQFNSGYQPNNPIRLGLRHLAGIAMAKNSDAVTVSISEETGDIMFCLDDQMERKITINKLREQLEKVLLDENLNEKTIQIQQNREVSDPPVSDPHLDNDSPDSKSTLNQTNDSIAVLQGLGLPSEQEKLNSTKSKGIENEELKK